MKNQMDWEFFLRELTVGVNIDETCFYFSDDPNEEEHYLGYLPQYDKPYWVGYCDIDGGCDFDTAEELVQAKIFNGKSLKERWNRVVICSIEGLSYEDWLEDFEHEPVNPQSDEIIE